jgi:rhamnosyltransferase subunit B
MAAEVGAAGWMRLAGTRAGHQAARKGDPGFGRGPAPRNSMSHILLTAFGTSGSVFPIIWLGRNLVERGHRVSMIADPLYGPRVVAAGIGFFPPAGDELARMLADPDLWNPGHSSRVAFTYGGRAVAPWMAALERVIGEAGPPELMLAPMIAFGARLAREKYGIPLVTVHLYPAAMMSADDAPLVFPALRLLRLLPFQARRFILSLPSPYDRFALPAVAAACLTHGVAPPRRLWKLWHHSPDGVLALFPGWFSSFPRDRPANTFQWDFPLEDMAREGELEPELEAFLAAGPKPVLFTLGTGQFHAADFFRTAAEVVARLGCRAVFLTPKLNQVPADLPDSVFVAAYAPFSQILPRAALMVHHGGIGTLSQCLAAGIPQLVVSMSLDQPDNAARVERLGVGLSLAMARLTPERLLPLVRRCLDEGSMQTAADGFARRLRQRHPVAALLGWLEDTLAAAAR